MADKGAIADGRYDAVMFSANYPVGMVTTAILDSPGVDANAATGIGWGNGVMAVEGLAIDALVQSNTPIKSIAGTITVSGTPASRLVRIYHKATGVLVAQQWSTSAGVFSIPGAWSSEYFIVAFPSSGDAVNAIIFDGIKAA